ncbi:MAG: capsular biosynthesis protein [Planctomycetes bacterium]|nr:capsular biosynthesis protein [Planctomycetota bacterium]
MEHVEPFVDIHCHLIPDIDDGARSWEESLAMARMAAADGTGTIVVTPHQLGAYGHNTGDVVRARTRQLQQFLDDHDVPLRVLPGGDVRIEAEMIAKLRTGEVMSLADRRKHVLLELPHEMYFPLEPVLDDLASLGMVGILSHPERNQGILESREILGPLVDRGCLMQITAGSLMGTFGPHCQQLSEWMLEQGLTHFVATDAHSSKSRRPLMGRAFERVAELVDWSAAVQFCCHNPAAVAAGRDVAAGRATPKTKSRWGGWRAWRQAG